MFRNVGGEQLAHQLSSGRLIRPRGSEGRAPALVPVDDVAGWARNLALDRPCHVGRLVANEDDLLWIPLVPQSEGSRSIRLERGTVVYANGRTSDPRGRLLEPESALSLFEDELPRRGLLVSRAWQLARSVDGATVAWIGRCKRPGCGEGSGGLAFDRLVPPGPPAG
jgi:hypothetical protein